MLKKIFLSKSKGDLRIITNEETRDSSIQTQAAAVTSFERKTVTTNSSISTLEEFKSENIKSINDNRYSYVVLEDLKTNNEKNFDALKEIISNLKLYITVSRDIKEILSKISNDLSS